jgi:hypothetical protein
MNNIEHAPDIGVINQAATAAQHQTHLSAISHVGKRSEPKEQHASDPYE